MQNQDIAQAVALFDTSDKWNAFLDLCDQRDRIRNAMWKKLVRQGSQAFQKQPEGWKFESLNPEEPSFIWYLSEYGSKSICIVFGWQGQFYMELRNGPSSEKIDEINQLLVSMQFQAIQKGFSRIDEYWKGIWPFNERYNFSFETPWDEDFHPNQLAWYAHFQTTDFIEQIEAKIAKFQTTEMTQVLSELNRLGRV